MSNKTDHILVTYFSRAGNTRKIAILIQKTLGGTLHEIRPKVPYPNSYHATVEMAKKEIKAGYQPPLETSLDTMEPYEIILLGTPNWWSTLAPPVRTFLAQHDLSERIIAPFCTHGGGGIGKITRDIAKLCPKSTLLPGFTIYGSGGEGAQAEISAWLEEIGLLS